MYTVLLIMNERWGGHLPQLGHAPVSACLAATPQHPVGK